jgi:hypothetical protein
LHFVLNSTRHGEARRRKVRTVIITKAGRDFHFSEFEEMTRLLLAFLCSAHCTNADAATMQTGVFVDFSTPPASTFKTTASYQIVTNPLLDKTYELANGSVIPNPIHDNAWASVKNLNADHVRFQPWFPFPHKVRICTLPSCLT